MHLHVIKADQLTAEVLEAVDRLHVTDGAIATPLWERTTAHGGREVWVALSELTPAQIKPVVMQLVGLGYDDGLLPARWWN